MRHPGVAPSYGTYSKIETWRLTLELKLLDNIRVTPELDIFWETMSPFLDVSRIY